MATTKPKKTTTKKPATKKTAEKAVKATKTVKKPAVKAAKPSTNKIKSSVGKTKVKKNPCRIIVPIAIIVAVVGIIAMIVLFFCMKDRDLVCSREDDVEGRKVVTSMVSTFKDGKVETISGQMEFESEEDANQYCAFMNLIANTDDVSCEGTVMRVKNLVTEEDEAEYLGLSRSEISAKLEENEYTCKK